MAGRSAVRVATAAELDVNDWLAPPAPGRENESANVPVRYIGVIISYKHGEMIRATLDAKKNRGIKILIDLALVVWCSANQLHVPRVCCAPGAKSSTVGFSLRIAAKSGMASSSASAAALAAWSLASSFFADWARPSAIS